MKQPQQIHPSQLIAGIATNRQNIIALQQELAMHQLSIENALEDANSDLYHRYIWHTVKYSAKHLEIARSSLYDQSPVDLASTQNLDTHIEGVRQQAIDDGMTVLYIYQHDTIEEKVQAVLEFFAQEGLTYEGNS